MLRKESLFHLVVYPRVYGEIVYDSDDPLYNEGLPPCVRGNQKPYKDALVYQRSTPVCTGKSSLMTTMRSPVGVYPRVYGEIFRGI